MSEFLKGFAKAIWAEDMDEAKSTWEEYSRDLSAEEKTQHEASGYAHGMNMGNRWNYEITLFCSQAA